jgi:hypothetical protein
MHAGAICSHGLGRIAWGIAARRNPVPSKEKSRLKREKGRSPKEGKPERQTLRGSDHHFYTSCIRPHAVVTMSISLVRSTTLGNLGAERVLPVSSIDCENGQEHFLSEKMLILGQVGISECGIGEIRNLAYICRCCRRPTIGYSRALLRLIDFPSTQ